MALPKGFGKTLKALIAQGHDHKTAMKEAWKLHKASGPGMRPGKLYNPKKVSQSAPVKYVLPAKEIFILYTRTSGEYKGQKFRHKFKSDVQIEALENGNLLLRSRSGRKLFTWQ